MNEIDTSGINMVHQWQQDRERRAEAGRYKRMQAFFDACGYCTLGISIFFLFTFVDVWEIWYTAMTFGSFGLLGFNLTQSEKYEKRRKELEER